MRGGGRLNRAERRRQGRQGESSRGGKERAVGAARREQSGRHLQPEVVHEPVGLECSQRGLQLGLARRTPPQRHLDGRQLRPTHSTAGHHVHGKGRRGREHAL